jgi:GNAT superfamily N-acetyltransferase
VDAENVEIRPITPGDVDVIARLLVELATEFIFDGSEREAHERFLGKNDASAIRRFIEDGFRYHVAEIDGVLVGFVGIRDNSHLYHLFVAKPVHSRGIGRQLWEHAKRECARNGHCGAFTVNASLNAVPIYERWGFRRDGPPREGDGVLYNPMKLEADG